MGVLFFYNGLFIDISVGNLLGNLAVLLLVRSYPHVHGAARWAVYFSVFGCALVFWYLVSVLVWIVVFPVLTNLTTSRRSDESENEYKNPSRRLRYILSGMSSDLHRL